MVTSIIYLSWMHNQQHEASDPFAYHTERKHRDYEWGKVGNSDMPWLNPCLNE